MNSENEINEFMPLREVVFLTLRKAILRGELRPGDRLMEITLAKEMGVSRTPIREAIRMLEHEGLVVMKPRRGAQVARISLQELNDVLEVRKSLEMLAITKACERMTEGEIAVMRQAERKFEALIADKNGDITEIAEADLSFHNVIYQGTKNRRLLQILANLREQMYRLRVEYLKEADIWDELVNEHRMIIDAISSRDKDKAVDRIVMHVENQWAAIQSTIEGSSEE